jgi:hypothetical protein
MGKKRGLPPGFVYDRPVPGRWAEELALLAPKTDHRPWLLLTWMSGDPWEETLVGGRVQYGVQRWVVYEMVPLRVWWGLIQAQRQRGLSDSDIIELYILECLQGPDPRTMGHYDEVLDRFISDAEVSRQEWLLFREHRAIPKLFWIIQGQNGGHKRTYTPLESKYLRMLGKPGDPPRPGSLPYADFDQRVLHQLARRDRIHKLADHLSPIESEQDAQLVEIRRQVIGWLEEQVREDLENHRLDLSGIPTSSAKEDDPTGHIEESIERFIQTGTMQPPPEEM